jgi:hypothetical protein
LRRTVAYRKRAAAFVPTRRRKIYRLQDYVTPYETLRGLPEAERFLKPGIGFERLERQASA